MDDDEYYAKLRNHNLNRSSSASMSGWKNPYAGLSKKVAAKKSNAVLDNEAKSDFKNWAVTQGREDAEMLYERRHEDLEEN